MLSVLLMALGAAPAALGPRVAVHPLVVVGGDARALEQSRADFQVEAARQAVQMVPPSQVSDAIAKQPGGACVDHPGCLEKVCADTRAVYGLIASLGLDGPAFVVSARVVAADGTVVQALEGLTFEKDPFSPRAPQLQAVFKQLFAKLALGALAPTLTPKPAPVASKPDPVAPAPVEVKAAPPVVVAAVPLRPEPAPEGMPALRIAGLIVGAVAVGTAGVGVGLGVVSVGKQDELRSLLRGGLLRNDPADIQKAKDLDALNANVVGVFGAAGVVAATSAVMLLLSIGSSPSQVSFAPVPGGAVVGVAGAF